MEWIIKLSYIQILFFVYSNRNIDDVKIYNDKSNTFYVDFVIKDSTYSMVYSGGECMEYNKVKNKQ
jgi:hypothetical protein